MNAAPHTGSPRKQLRAARAMASLQRASTSRVDQKFMTKIKIARITQKDVKNEGTSADVYENKGDVDKIDGNRDGFLSDNAQIAR
jgi:hypothetical protein